MEREREFKRFEMLANQMRWLKHCPLLSRCVALIIHLKLNIEIAFVNGSDVQLPLIKPTHSIDEANTN